jgi:hypothetical protein
MIRPMRLTPDPRQLEPLAIHCIANGLTLGRAIRIRELLAENARMKAEKYTRWPKSARMLRRIEQAHRDGLEKLRGLSRRV